MTATAGSIPPQTHEGRMTLSDNALPIRPTIRSHGTHGVLPVHDEKRAGTLNPSPRWTGYALALYPIGAYLVALPTVDLLTRTYPMAIHTVAWRFGFSALAFTNLGTALLGFVAIGLAAVLAGHRRMLRTLSVVAFLAALAVLVAIPFYALDALQIRKFTAPAMQMMVMKSAITATTAAMLGVLAFAGVGVAAWRGSRTASRAEAGGSARSGELVFSKNLSGGAK